MELGKGLKTHPRTAVGLSLCCDGQHQIELASAVGGRHQLKTLMAIVERCIYIYDFLGMLRCANFNQIPRIKKCVANIQSGNILTFSCIEKFSNTIFRVLQQREKKTN
jgi:hypothetical protein